MFLTKPKSVATTLNLALVAVTTIIMTAFGYVNYSETRSKALAELDEAGKIVSARVATNVAASLWNLDTAQASAVLASEMAYRNVSAIVVQEASKKVFAAKGRSADGQATDMKTDLESPKGLLLTEADVLRDKSNLGKVKVYVSTAFLDAQLQSELIRAAVGILAVDAAIVLILSLVISKVLVRPIRSMQAYAQEVGNGNLTCTLLEGLFIGELGSLKVSLETMVCNLKRSVDEVQAREAEAKESAHMAETARAAADEARDHAVRARAEGMLHAAGVLEGIAQRISSASEEISVQVQDVASAAQSGKGQLAESATAMEEMNSTVLEVAKKASLTAEQAGQAREMAASGAKVVEQAVGSIDLVARQTNDLQVNVAELGRQAEGIGNVINVINDIADQTNLLALNAAIEAARAGDAGRGFAVVADEVRKLAEKTMIATKEVAESIRSIQHVTRLNVDAAAKASSAVGEATELAASSGQALSGIVTIVGTTSDHIRDIATAAEEQSASSEHINRSLDSVAQVTEQTAQGMVEAGAAIAELAEQTSELARLIEMLKTDGTAVNAALPAGVSVSRKNLKLMAA